MSNQSSSNNSQSSSRWWEYYLARYLLPTIVGVFIVIWLANKLECNYFQKNLEEWDIGYSIALISCGFAFCYIASFPALSFHAIRSIFFKKSLTLLLISAIIIPICLLFIPFLCYKITPDFYNRHFEIIYIPFLFFSLIQIIIICINSNAQYSYIEKLSIKRTKSKTDITESYRHLREHGNTAFIFILEMILAVGCDFIINHPSINKNGNSIKFFSEYITLFNGKIDVQLAAITFLFIIWSLPGVFVYFLGQYFEYQFANSKEHSEIIIFDKISLITKNKLKQKNRNIDKSSSIKEKFKYKKQ